MIFRIKSFISSPCLRSSGKMHHWYHVDCLLASFKTQRATSKSIESLDDIQGWSTLGDLDREAILEKLQTLDSFRRGSDDSSANAAPENVCAQVCACASEVTIHAQRTPHRSAQTNNETLPNRTRTYTGCRCRRCRCGRGRRATLPAGQ